MRREIHKSAVDESEDHRDVSKEAGSRTRLKQQEEQTMATPTTTPGRISFFINEDANGSFW